MIASIGAGGMGEVYRARDTKLNRDVALKILPDVFAADPDRLGRFTREAQTLASLNHPNIAQIHGLEDGLPVRALVMELVDGPDLAQRIAQGPIPADEAIAIARQIADAIEAAHELGIVHRDLKPANVKVRDDGTVKVLDFGLAKAFEGSGPASTAGALSLSPTFASPVVTSMGMVMGTAGYMAPEQAKGKTVDRRADIWAFGVVFYEMLTGRALFEAETVSEVLASVIMRDAGPDRAPLVRARAGETPDRALPREGSEAPAQGHRRSASRADGIDPDRAGREPLESSLHGQPVAGSGRPRRRPCVGARGDRDHVVAHRHDAVRGPCHPLRSAAPGQDIARARGTAQRRVVAATDR